MTAEPITRSGKVLVHSRWITTRKTGNLLSRVRFPKKKKSSKNIKNVWRKAFMKRNSQLRKR